MKNLKDMINKLPKEIRDIIEEYNVNHRPLMNRVLEELTFFENKCNFCKILITNQDEIRYYGLYIYTWNRNKQIYCSPECCESGDSDILKARHRWLNKLKNLEIYYSFRA